MKNYIMLFLATATLLLISNCAGSFHEIKKYDLVFQNKSQTDSLEYSYLYDVFGITNNKRYSKIEQKRDLKTIAFKITNNSKEIIELSYNNLHLTSNGRELYMIPPKSAALQLKQLVMPYALWSFLNVYYSELDSDGNVETTTLPIGIPIALVNMGNANISNLNLKKALIQYYPIGKKIKPGQSLTAIIVTHDFGYEPINITID